MDVTDHEEVHARPVASAFSSGFANITSPFLCPENCTCNGNSIKCGSQEIATPASLLASSSSAASLSSDEEDLYLDDRSVAPYDANELNKLSKHLDPNSNKLSLLLCQKGRCIPIDDPSMNYECKCKSGFSGPFCEQGMCFIHDSGLSLTRPLAPLTSLFSSMSHELDRKLNS